MGVMVCPLLWVVGNARFYHQPHSAPSIAPRLDQVPSLEFFVRLCIGEVFKFVLGFLSGFYTGLQHGSVSKLDSVA